jgi:hypothetical protein
MLHSAKKARVKIVYKVEVIFRTELDKAETKRTEIFIKKKAQSL